jgi:sugar phosphate isomerase/epimerase
MSPAEQHSVWRELGLTRLSLIDSQLDEPGLAQLVAREGYTVDTVYHLFESGAGLSRVIESAAAVGARVVYMLTGGRGELRWEQAAERFSAAIAPCVNEARQAGVSLAIENASALYADIHFAHTLRDTLTLAEMAGVAVCIDLFHCWAEADLGGLLERALPRTVQIQLSDYVLGDRALPGRAVPGDGAIPIEPFVRQALAGGYAHGFDLELIGPRIEAEGRVEAARRGCETISTMLERLDA